MSFPLSPDAFRTENKGQVAGLGGGAVKAILKDYGIDHTLAAEGGRTSRGSMGLMEGYVEFLNGLYDDGLLDLKRIEEFWIEYVRRYFMAKPLRIRPDISKSLRQIISELMEAARDRQNSSGGTMIVGAVLEHLVGAKLSLALPNNSISHKPFSAADEPMRAKGDFLIGDTAIHVTTAPMEALAAKCRHNLDEGLHPLVVTTESGTGGIHALAENEGIAKRMDVLEIGQFLTINVYEWIGFENKERALSLQRLVAEYNRIIDECETDPSLKIALN